MGCIAAGNAAAAWSVCRVVAVRATRDTTCVSTADATRSTEASPHTPSSAANARRCLALQFRMLLVSSLEASICTPNCAASLGFRSQKMRIASSDVVYGFLPMNFATSLARMRTNIAAARPNSECHYDSRFQASGPRAGVVADVACMLFSPTLNIRSPFTRSQRLVGDARDAVSQLTSERIDETGRHRDAGGEVVYRIGRHSSDTWNEVLYGALRGTIEMTHLPFVPSCAGAMHPSSLS